MKNLKKLVMFLFVMFLAITTISCTSKKKADNGEDKHNTGNIVNKQPDEVEKVVSSKITYQIEDVTLIEKEVKSNEEVELIDNIYIYRLLLSLFKQLKNLNHCIKNII